MKKGRSVVPHGHDNMATGFLVLKGDFRGRHYDRLEDHADHYLILAGDHLYRMDYRKFLARHYETNADITISVIPIVPDSASEFGLLKTDSAGRVIEFREKPKGDALEAMRVDTTALGSPQ